MYQHNFIYRLAALGVLCAAFTLSASATAISLSTGFDNGSPTSPTPAGSSVGSPDTFSVTGGNVFYLGGVANDPGNPCFVAGSTSATCLQLPTHQGVTAMLTSTKTFGAGEYRVEVEMAGGAANAIVLAELGAPQMLTVVAGTQFNTYAFVHTIPNGVITPLTITSNNEFLISSVRVGLLTGASAVPEPASWPTMLTAGLGFCGVGLYRRRRVGAVRSEQDDRWPPVR